MTRRTNSLAREFITDEDEKKFKVARMRDQAACGAGLAGFLLGSLFGHLRTSRVRVPLLHTQTKNTHHSTGVFVVYIVHLGCLFGILTFFNRELNLCFSFTFLQSSYLFSLKRSLQSPHLRQRLNRFLNNAS